MLHCAEPCRGRYNLGNALCRSARPVEAVDALLSCLRLAPVSAPRYVNLAHALRHLALLDQAQAMAEFGVELLPHVPDAKICLANVLHDRRIAAAAVLYRQVLEVAPGHAGALSSLGNTLRAMGHLGEALSAHARAVYAAPGDPEFRFSRALTLLAAGDFAQGWEEYEWRWRRPRRFVRVALAKPGAEKTSPAAPYCCMRSRGWETHCNSFVMCEW